MHKKLALLSIERVHPSDRKKVVLKEHARDGKAELEVKTKNAAKLVIAFDLGDKCEMKIFQDGQNCDGSVAICRVDDSWDAVVVEIKHSAGLNQITKARQQLRSGAARLRMVLAFLGIYPKSWLGVIVYANDKFSNATNPDPARMHPRVGVPSPESRGPIHLPESETTMAVQMTQFPLDAANVLRGALLLP